MKKITAMEFFPPLSQISRFTFLCADDLIEKVREVIHKIGTTGFSADHYFEVSDFEPNTHDNSQVGQRMSRLES